MPPRILLRIKELSLKQSATVASAVIAFVASGIAIWVFITGRPAMFDNKVTAQITRSPWLGIQVLQEGRLADVRREDLRTVRAKLKPLPFELRLPKHGIDDRYMLCGWTDRSIFSAIREGYTRDEVPYFSVGTGIADSPYTSATLYLDQEGHNHLAGERLGSDPMYHAVYYSSVMINGKEYRFTDYQKAIYVVVFADQDRNGIVGNEEYEFFIFDF
jgi:hypothetical protein